jgi:hypothetical protein
MTDATVKFEQARPAAEDAKREQSTIAFPYHDLDTSIELATALYNRTGLGPCDLDELAAEMGQVIGGAFRVKLGAARVFDLVDKDGRASATLTDLGRRIVSGEDERGAKSEAFLAVPLYQAIYDKYKGQKLPPMKALEREMEALGVSSKQKDKARQVFERAASQAGFFELGKDRLIRPKSEGGSGHDTDRSKFAGGGAPPPPPPPPPPPLTEKALEYRLVDLMTEAMGDPEVMNAIIKVITFLKVREANGTVQPKSTLPKQNEPPSGGSDVDDLIG